jgi:hypothetical protein
MAGVIGPAWHEAGSLELARGWCGWVVWAKGWVTGTRAGGRARVEGRRGHAHGLHLIVSRDVRPTPRQAQARARPPGWKPGRRRVGGKKVWCSRLQTGKIDLTCSSNNTAKTLFGGPTGVVNPPFCKRLQTFWFTAACTKFFFQVGAALRHMHGRIQANDFGYSDDADCRRLGAARSGPIRFQPYELDRFKYLVSQNLFQFILILSHPYRSQISVQPLVLLLIQMN